MSLDAQSRQRPWHEGIGSARLNADPLYVYVHLLEVTNSYLEIAFASQILTDFIKAASY